MLLSERVVHKVLCKKYVINIKICGYTKKNLNEHITDYK